MHQALFKLIALQARGLIRRMLRGAGSPARLAAFIVGALVFCIWLGSALFTLKFQHHTDPQRVRDVMPIALLAICIMTAVTSAGDKAIAFTPGEVDQLFPGPFTRRELLAYKLIKSTLAALLTALILSVVMLKHALSWPACFTGVLLSLLLVQWFSISILLCGQAIGQFAYSRLRRLILVGAGVLVVLAVRLWMSAGLAGGEAAVAQFRQSLAGRIVLAPFDPFGNIMTSRGTGELMKWAAYGIFIDLAVLSLVFLLDGYYVEAAMAASGRRYAKIRRIRAGSFLSIGIGKTGGRRLPRFPWAGGAGPVAWRQATSATRSSRGLLLLLLIVAIGAAPALSMGGRAGGAAQLLAMVMLWLTFLCSSMLNFDFRGDVDGIENLKSLPISEMAVSAGQLIVPVLLLSLFHWVLLGIALATLHSQRRFLLAALIMALPFNAVLFGAENLIFLLFPSRPAAASPGDFQVLGRKFVFLLLKAVIVGSACMVAVLAGALAWAVTGGSLVATTSLAWIVLAAEAAALLPLVAWAYRRFDPSIHTPA